MTRGEPGGRGAVRAERRAPRRSRPSAPRPRRCAIPLSLVRLALVCPPLVASTPQVSEVGIGEPVPDFQFKPFLAGGDGRQRLSEFRGQPVLIVNWTDTDFGRGAADEARKLCAELVPDGLVVVLRDTHNRSADEILCSRLRRYPDNPARFMGNMELPIVYLDNGPPPDVALIDCEGVLAVAGSYTVDLRKAEKRIQAELKKRSTGWGESPQARKARALLHGKCRLADARALCEQALAGEPGNAELLAVRDEVLAVHALRERMIRHPAEQGAPGLALEQARGLRAAVAGDAEWERQADGILAGFATPEALSELELDEDLEAILRRVHEKGPRAKEVEELRSLAERAGDTAVGRRAAGLARVAALCAD